MSRVAVRASLALAADEAADRLRRDGRAGACSCRSSTQSFGQQMQGRSSTRGSFPKQLMNFGGGDVLQPRPARSPSATSTRSRSSCLDLRHRVHDVRGRRRASARHARGRSSPGRCRAGRCTRRSWSALVLFLGLVLASSLVGTIIGSRLAGVLDELPFERLPLLWLNGMLLWGAIGGDRAGRVGRRSTGSSPAIGVTLAIVIVSLLPRDPRLALARREGPPAVLAVPLPHREGHPRRHDERRRAGPPGGRGARRDRLGGDRVPATGPRGPELIVSLPSWSAGWTKRPPAQRRITSRGPSAPPWSGCRTNRPPKARR